MPPTVYPFHIEQIVDYLRRSETGGRIDMTEGDTV